MPYGAKIKQRHSRLWVNQQVEVTILMILTARGRTKHTRITCMMTRYNLANRGPVRGKGG